MKAKGFQQTGVFKKCSEATLVVHTAGFYEHYKILLTKKYIQNKKLGRWSNFII